MPIVTRIAVAPDLAVIVDIYNQAVAGSATAHLDPLTEDSQRRWFTDHDPDYPILVAEIGVAVVGWASFSRYRPGRGALRYTAELSYYVDAGHRRRGVATNLIERSIERCGRLGFKTLIAILLADNQASIALLEKFGFELWAHLPNIADFDGREVGHLYYGLRVA